MPKRHTVFVKFFLGLFIALCGVNSNADPVDLSVPYCHPLFDLNPATGLCKAKPAEVANLKPAECITIVGLKLNGSSCAPDVTEPQPQCRAVLGQVATLKNGKCTYEPQSMTSASGDYVGDFFTIAAVPEDNPGKLGFPAGTVVKVLSQKSQGSNDELLTVAPVMPPKYLPYIDLDPVGPSKTIAASELIEYGASRTGWTYGVLAVPYKYYTHDKKFGDGVSIGPYIGRRWGRPGSAWTLAASAAIGKVKGQVLDDAGKVTSTPDLMAYSLAAGVMWDVSKRDGIKPFKVGLFTGQDIVGEDDKVKFKNNRKWWLALQIGFDFTDN